MEGADYYTSYLDMRPEPEGSSEMQQQWHQPAVGYGASDAAYQQSATLQTASPGEEAAFFNEPEMTELQL